MPIVDCLVGSGREGRDTALTSPGAKRRADARSVEYKICGQTHSPYGHQEGQTTEKADKFEQERDWRAPPMRTEYSKSDKEHGGMNIRVDSRYFDDS